VLSRAKLDAMLERLAGMPLAQRRGVRGLDPARAPTIVAGVVVLARVLDGFGLSEVEVSDRDILWGVALDLAL
jgi:exopolyphosphatase / guanosine-5'-triphosphate,3'-diphosphate pyrophosphatase